jgi:hypothetical protein
MPTKKKKIEKAKEWHIERPERVKLTAEESLKRMKEFAKRKEKFIAASRGKNFRPDCFFTAEQQQRLEELMGRWRTARDMGTSLSDEEQTELESLVEAEVRATTERASALQHYGPRRYYPLTS